MPFLTRIVPVRRSRSSAPSWKSIESHPIFDIAPPLPPTIEDPSVMDTFLNTTPPPASTADHESGTSSPSTSTTNTSLESEYQHYELLVKDMEEDHAKQLKEKDEQIQRLRKQVATLAPGNFEEVLETFNQDLDEANGRIMMLQDELAAKQEEVKILSNMNDAKNRELEENEFEELSARSQLQELLPEVVLRREEVEQLKDEVQKLSEEKIDHWDRLGDDSMTNAQADMVVLRRKISELVDDHEPLHRTIRALKDEMKVMADRIAEAEDAGFLAPDLISDDGEGESDEETEVDGHCKRPWEPNKTLMEALYDEDMWGEIAREEDGFEYEGE